MPSFPVARSFACAVALTGLAAAGYGMVDYWRAWPLMQDAARLEAGERYRRIPQREAVVNPQLQRPAGFCNATVARALVTVRLAMADAVVESDSFARFDGTLDDAALSLRDLLRCSPLDGNAWLRLAMVEVQRGGPTPAVVQALEASYLAAPVDLWVMRARIPFVARLVTSGVSGLEKPFETELDVFLDKAFSQDIAAVYAATPENARKILEARLKDFAPQRYAGVYRAVIATGIKPDASSLPPPSPPAPRYPR